MNKLTCSVIALALVAPLGTVARAQSNAAIDIDLHRFGFDPQFDITPIRDDLLSPPRRPPWIHRNESLLAVFPDRWPAGFDATRPFFVDIPTAPEGDSMQLSDQTFSPCWNPPLVHAGSQLIFSSGSDRGTYHGSFVAREMSPELKDVFRSATRDTSEELVLSFVVGGAYGSYRPGNYFFRPITISLNINHFSQLAGLRFSRTSSQPRFVQVIRPDGGFDDAGVPAPTGGSSLDELWVTVSISASQGTVRYLLVYTNESGTIDREDELEYPIDLPDSTWNQRFNVSVHSDLTGAECGVASYNQLVLTNMTLRARSFRYQAR